MTDKKDNVFKYSPDCTEKPLEPINLGETILWESKLKCGEVHQGIKFAGKKQEYIRIFNSDGSLQRLFPNNTVD